MADPTGVQFQPVTHGMPPVKLDGKVYVIMSGTYQFTYSEKLISEAYGGDASIDRQMVATGKHRWSFTILVPTSTTNISLDSGSSLSNSDLGTLNDLRGTVAKLPPVDLLDFYDTTQNYDFSGDPTHSVYVVVGPETISGDDIGMWEVPVELWGYDYA